MMFSSLNEQITVFLHTSAVIHGPDVTVKMLAFSKGSRKKKFFS